MASVVGVAGLAKVRNEIEHRLGNAHVLSCVVLAEIRESHHQRQPKDVRHILTSYTAQTLYTEETRKRRDLV